MHLCSPDSKIDSPALSVQKMGGGHEVIVYDYYGRIEVIWLSFLKKL